jgi:hypothetical protein
VRGWSRHGTDLTARLGSLLVPFVDVARGTPVDGELIAISERGGTPAQDFATSPARYFPASPPRQTGCGSSPSTSSA